MDRFSPVAPAYVRALVLPIGQIERQRFLHFVGRLQNEACIVQSTDLARYVDDNNILLSPQAFPRGCILFNYSTSATSLQEGQLSPFELFREPLLVVGVVGGHVDRDGSNQKELGASVLRERYPRVVYRQLLVLDDANVQSSQAEDGAIRIANASEDDDPALKDAICRISARFLKELSTYTRAMQASPSVQTPGQTARKLQRTNSQRDQEKRPSSGHSTPTRSVDLDSPAESSGGSRPPPLDRNSPATSFDQIPSASNTASNISGSDSRTSNKGKHARASSQDRVSIQGFGSGTSQDKLKQRGKARVGIVIGTIYMAAGQWSEALKLLNEHTNKARILSDHIWHAKGLENIVVCLLLHSWAGLEFQIPSVCYLMAEKISSQQRHSANLSSDLKTTDAAQVASVRRLSTSLPELFKLVLSLYRSVEGSLELPHGCIAEATIRFTKLLAMLYRSGGELESSTIDQLIGRSKQSASSSFKPSPTQGGGSFTKASIAEILASAHSGSEDSLQASEQVVILSGIASVYALLEMKRKRANTLKDLVTKLTNALTQARKHGTAEIGTNPGASISAEAGTDAFLALSEGSDSLTRMMREVALVYGAQIPVQGDQREASAEGDYSFGSDQLKLSTLNHLTAFFEAAPDPSGVVQMTSAILSIFGINDAVDADAIRYTGILTKDDEARLSRTLMRNVGVSQHLGLSDAEAVYWDHYLVRGVEFLLPSSNVRIIERGASKSRPGTAVNEVNGSGGNPLLYDPNANRPGEAPAASENVILVSGEPSVCLVTLQNPYDVPIEIESLTLVTDDVELKTRHPPFSLQPMRLQQVPLTVFPSDPGDYKINTVRVKVSGCVEEAFPIVSKAWAPEASTLVKHIGQDTLAPEDPESVQRSHAEHAVVALKVVEPQPLLVLEDPKLQNNNIMLLDGEKHALNVVVRNSSNIALGIFEISKAQTRKHRPDSSLEKGPPQTNEIVPLEDSIVIEAGQTQNFEFALEGRANVSRMQLSFMYSDGLEDGQYARVLRTSIDLTVNAALQAQHFTAKAIGENNESFMLSFDLRNAWPRPLEYTVKGPTALLTQQGTLHPGQIERVYQVLPRFPLDLSASNNSDALTKSLQNSLSVKWMCEGRTGDVDLTSLTLSNEEAEVVAKPVCHIDLSLISATRPVKVGSFVTLGVKVSAEPSATEPLFVQLQVHTQHSSDGDSTMRPGAMVHGASHRILRPSSKMLEAEFSLCTVLVGTVELEVTAKAVLSSSKPTPIATRSIKLEVV